MSSPEFYAGEQFVFDHLKMNKQTSVKKRDDVDAAAAVAFVSSPFRRRYLRTELIAIVKQRLENMQFSFVSLNGFLGSRRLYSLMSSDEVSKLGGFDLSMNSIQANVLAFPTLPDINARLYGKYALIGIKVTDKIHPEIHMILKENLSVIKDQLEDYAYGEITDDIISNLSDVVSTNRGMQFQRNKRVGIFPEVQILYPPPFKDYHAKEKEESKPLRTHTKASTETALCR